MVSIHGIVEVDPIEEEDAGDEEEDEGEPEEQGAHLAFEDARDDREDEAGEFKGEGDDEARDAVQLAVGVPEHRAEDAQTVVIQILRIIEGIGEENEHRYGGHQGDSKAQQHIDFAIHKFTYRRVIYATYKKGTRRFSLP